MKVIFGFILAALMGASVFAQKSDDVLATATGRTFKLSDLSPEAGQAVSSLPTRIFATRAAILDQMVNQRLLDIEAKAMGISSGKIIANEKAKVATPTEAEIKGIYDANRQVLGEQTLEKARKQIIAYLRREPEQKVLTSLFSKLKIKFKYVAGKAVNTTGLAPADVVATINQQPITGKEFENFAKVAIYELSAVVGDLISEDLNEVIYTALIADEAKALSIDSGALIAREITDKLKDYSDEERLGLETALRKRLTSKYKVEILYRLPIPVSQNVSVDDDPSSGPADAPVTIVMFSDFQCPACSATHPVIKKAIDAFPGKVRFVVRDYPLESIHENAFTAARAAVAANAQGKFFEYAEILYSRQNALDVTSLRNYAAEIGLNAKQFELDFNSEKTVAEVRKDMADGDTYIVNSTPTIFINGVRLRNLAPASFRSAIERALIK